MTRRLCCLIGFLTLASVSSFAQSSFMGLTPDKSTRSDVERVLGRPVKKISETLLEYGSRQLKLADAAVMLNSGKIYVQYRDASAASVAVRIELIVSPRSTQVNKDNFLAMLGEYDRADSSTSSRGSLDAVQVVSDSVSTKEIWRFGPPRYMVSTSITKTSGAESSSELRWAFYSKELYQASAPVGNCTGMLRGEWETNRGRTTFTRGVESGRLRGTYSDDDGTFSGEIQGDNLKGDWKDSTGSGTMFLQLYYPGAKQFTGSWVRTSGKGPANGKWEGRCVGAANGTN